MVYRNVRNALVASLVVLPHLVAPANAQPKNHIGEELANIFITAGCTMNNQEIVAAMKAKGLHISDIQAQSMALAKGNYIQSGDGGETWRLTNWGACN